jgi:hypothetical protein
MPPLALHSLGVKAVRSELATMTTASRFGIPQNMGTNAHLELAPNAVHDDPWSLGKTVARPDANPVTKRKTLGA